MLPFDALSRIVILGNSGAGKSWLAVHLAERLGVPTLDLDMAQWEPGIYGRMRDSDEARAMVRETAAAERWIIEGVHGWLAWVAMPRATALIWSRIPVPECLDNLRGRGLRRGANDDALRALIARAGDYEKRVSSSSDAGHAALFTDFAGPKLILHSREEMAALLASMP